MVKFDLDEIIHLSGVVQKRIESSISGNFNVSLHHVNGSNLLVGMISKEDIYYNLHSYFFPLNNFSKIVKDLASRGFTKGSSKIVFLSESSTTGIQIEESVYTNRYRNPSVKYKLVSCSIDYEFDIKRNMMRLQNPLTLPDSLLDSNDSISSFELEKMRIGNMDKHISYYMFMRLNEILNKRLIGSSQADNLTDLIDHFYNKIISMKKIGQKEKDILYRNLLNLDILNKRSVGTISPVFGGFTSISSFTIEDIFVKMDKSSRIYSESQFYKNDFGGFNDFMPRPLVFVSDSEYGIMALSDVSRNVPGHILANIRFSNTFRAQDLKYHIFLMGLFHKEAIHQFNNLGPVGYRGVHNLPHYEESNIPHVNKDGLGFRMFKDTAIDFKDCICIVDNYRNYQSRYADSVIHGDWKKENVPNGYLVDFAMVGRGFAVDELAYFLSDAKFRISRDSFHNLIGQYINVRSTHDNEFARTDNSNLYKLADSSLLTQLVLRHSVMNKRDMNNPEKYEQRLYYQQAIKTLLKEGKFL